MCHFRIPFQFTKIITLFTWNIDIFSCTVLGYIPVKKYWGYLRPLIICLCFIYYFFYVCPLYFTAANHLFMKYTRLMDFLYVVYNKIKVFSINLSVSLSDRRNNSKLQTLNCRLDRTVRRSGDLPSGCTHDSPLLSIFTW